mmetsp:Transcript_482/g.1056  ORF Transcript_482/g.1056 Transcript_482/m.1056 type:complete len:251 (+) Transcript_482:151-903(+)
MCRRCIDLSSLKDFVDRQQAPPAVRTKRAVLIVLTSNDKLGDTGKNTGWSLPEVASIHAVFQAADFKTVYASPKGGIAPLDTDSVAADEASRSFHQNEETLRLTKTTIPIADAVSTDFDCVFYVGGAGGNWDLPDCTESQALAAEIYEAGGVVAGVSHGTCALLNVTLSYGAPLMKRKLVTAITNEEADAMQIRSLLPLSCEDRFGELGACFSGLKRFQENVVVDGKIITGQNTASAASTAKAVVVALSG